MQNKIKELRKEIGMTQVRLSIELEVSQETISAYEKGKHLPSVPALVKMSEIFYASTDYILGLSAQRYPTAPTLSKDEYALLGRYRNLNEVQKACLFAYIQGMIDQTT